MSSRRSTKRRRSQAAVEGDATKNAATVAQPENVEDEEVEVADPPPEDATAPVEEDAPENEAARAARAEKEREVWDAFREEHFELVEQLPLSLHRSFKLILELDQQVHDYSAHMLPMLQKYIRLRMSLAGKEEPPQSETADAGALPGNDPDVEITDIMESSKGISLTKESLSVTIPGPGGTMIFPSPPKPSSSLASKPLDEPQSSRALLTRVAQLSEDIVKAANEKVNVARFTYDLVDRYIRDLDRSIKEQETAINLGLRPGTHPASIILPEVVVPATRAVRLQHSPTMDEHIPDATEPEAAEPAGVSLGITPTEPAAEGSAPLHPRRKRRAGAGWSRHRKVRQSTAPAETEEATAEEPGTEKTTTLKLTVPPLSSLNNVDMPVDPNEPRYCYCNQVSFGEMIACDNPDCKLEWFHLGCVGLTQAPKENVKWYCRNCEPLMSKRRRSRAH